jgi:hypothetical protein
MLVRTRHAPKRLKGSELAVALGFGIFVFGAFATELLREFSPAKLGVVFMAIAWLPLLVLHEAAHALVAASLGWRVCRVEVGLGPPLLRFSVRGVPVDVNLFPVAGFVIPAPRSLGAARIKSALVYFAGPGAELLVVALLVLLVGHDRILERGDSLGLIAAQSVAAAALIGVAFTLVPLEYTPEPASHTPGSITDGLGMIMSFVWPIHHFERMLGAPFFIAAERCIERGDFDGAARVFEQAVSEHPNNLPLRISLAQALTEAGRAAESRELLLPVVEHHGPWRALLLGALAAAEREIGDDTHVELADEHSRLALELVPGSPWAMTVRASVLLARSRFHPALELLLKAREAARDRELIDECDCWLILTDHRRGNREAARERLEQLHERGTAGRLLRAVEAEVLGRPAVSVVDPAHSA